ncbi:MAG: hypothetical protein KGZ73_10070 [Rhizobiales bacterium]|nr:hypothetical protein [Hyphomicrobiales bacterium]
MAKKSKKRGALRLKGERHYELTKIDVAEAHIKTAVWLYFQNAHPVPIYTLASAAREILTTIGDKIGVETTLHRLAKKRGESLKSLIAKIHLHATFFKHANSDTTATLDFSETEVDPVLQLACHDFGRVAKGMPIEAQVFEAFIMCLAFARVSDAPLRRQQMLKFAFQHFYGVRSSTLAEAKKIGLRILERAASDPTLQMEYSRVVTPESIR